MIVQGHIQGQDIISRLSKQKYDFYQIQIGTSRIPLAGVILTEKKSDTIYMIQGHLQCQRVKLNVVYVTNYDNAIFTLAYASRKKYFCFILNGFNKHKYEIQV